MTCDTCGDSGVAGCERIVCPTCNGKCNSDTDPFPHCVDCRNQGYVDEPVDCPECNKPTPDEVLAALKHHPDLLAAVAHQAALVLVDEWVDYGAGIHNRYLACTPRTPDSRVCWVEPIDGNRHQWMAVTGSGRVAGEVYPTRQDAMGAADDSIRRMGYIVIDKPFNTLRGGPRRRF